MIPLSKAFKFALIKRGFSAAHFKGIQIRLPLWMTNHNPNFYKDKFFHQETLVFCPICWKDSEIKYFKTPWAFSLIIVCHIHGVLLRDDCPKCGKKLFSNKNNSLIAINYFNVNWIDSCKFCNHNYLDDKKFVVFEPDIFKVQVQVLQNILSSRNNYIITDKNLIFGINWYKNEPLTRYLELVKSSMHHSSEFLNLKNSITKNPIAFELYKTELIRLLDLDELNGKIHWLEIAKQWIANHRKCGECNLILTTPEKYREHHYDYHQSYYGILGKKNR